VAKAKSNNNPLIMLGAACLLVTLFILALIAYKLLAPQALTKDDCYKLGSNLRMEECLNEIDQKTQVSPTQFDISQLTILDKKMDGNTYYNSNPTFSATIKNNGTSAASNVIAKFKFFPYNSAQSCADDSTDTVYLKISNIILPGDTQLVKQIVTTNFDTSDAFTWCAEIVSATN
jgi:hypothetical protein